MSDELADYRDEWRLVVSRLIARAWVDPDFKAVLIDDPTPALHAEGLMFPAHYSVEFYEDPVADPGDWHSIGRGGRAVHRFAIPPPPERMRAEAEPLGHDFDASGLACCCPCASCTGAVSEETWR
jgi:hypothetical protein